MTDNDLQRFNAATCASPDTVLEDEDLVRISIFYYLRGCGFENPAELDDPATDSRSASVSQDHPRSVQLRLIINDARTSIVIALQRHWNNEQYRQRLAAEQHYRVLQPHVSEQFRRLMVRASHLVDIRHSTVREPQLAAKYQDEIDRLEQEWRLAGVIQ